MADLEPITREESFLNGTDLEPITRKEYFYAGKESELPEGHREPKTREEWFIKKYREAGDVTVESLSVTENGTYTASEGKAYSPVSVDVQPTLISKSITANGDYSASSDNADGYSSVSVNVPLPENAYLLKEIENVDIATFTDGSDLPMPKLEVAIEPVQSGSGDPSPTNIRPISGWDEVNVSVCGKNLINSDNYYSDYKIASGAYRLTGTQGSINKVYIPSNFVGKEITVSAYVDLTKEPAPTRIVLLGSINGQAVTGNNILADDKGITSITITATSTNDYFFFDYGSNGNNYYEITWVQVELGTEVTTYEPYNGQTYTIDLDGTRYGGTLDLVSGVLTVDRAMVDLGSCAWDVRSESVIRCTVSAEANFESQYKAVNGICSAYIIVAQNSLGDGKLSFNNSTQVYLHDDNHTFSTQSDAQQYLNGQKLVYELATPTTIQLTPTQVKSLVGQNNAWANSGKILNLSYLAKEE